MKRQKETRVPKDSVDMRYLDSINSAGMLVYSIPNFDTLNYDVS